MRGGSDIAQTPGESEQVEERERARERGLGHLDEKVAEKAGKAAERKFVSRRGFDEKKKESFATAKVVVFPENPVAGQTIEIFYRGGAMDLDPKGTASRVSQIRLPVYRPVCDYSLCTTHIASALFYL